MIHFFVRDEKREKCKLKVAFVGRTRPCITSGAKTKLSHFVTGLVLIAFTVFGGGEVLAVLPKAVLGALVGCGVLPLLGPTTKMQPLFDNFMQQPYEVKRDCILCWATAMFTFTATPTLDIGLYKGIALALVFKCYEKAGTSMVHCTSMHETPPPPLSLGWLRGVPFISSVSLLLTASVEFFHHRACTVRMIGE